MNSTSPSARLVRIAARSPERSIAGPLVIRMPGAQLGRDDHGQGRLAQAGRAGQQDVVGRGAAAHRALQQQVELLAHPVLGDELGQPAWAGRSPRRRARRRRRTARRRPSSLIGCGPSSRIACLSSTGTGGGVAVDRLGDRGHRLVGLAARPAERRPAPWRTCSVPDAAERRRPRRRRRRRPGRSGRAAPGPGARRPSCRCRAPGSASAVSPVAIARRTASGWCTASTAWASRGPTPLAVCSSSKRCFSSSSAKP